MVDNKLHYKAIPAMSKIYVTETYLLRLKMTNY